MSACEYDAPNTALELGGFEVPFAVFAALLRQKGEVVLLQLGQHFGMSAFCVPYSGPSVQVDSSDQHMSEPTNC